MNGRLAIDEAAEIIDPQFIGIVSELEASGSRLAQAERIAREARAEHAANMERMRIDAIRLGCDNTVPSRSIPNLRQAALRELGLHHFAPKSAGQNLD